MRWWWWPYTEFQFSFATLQYENHNFQMGICLRYRIYHLHSVRCTLLDVLLSHAMDLSCNSISIEIYWRNSSLKKKKTCPINKRLATLTYKKITHLLLAFWCFCLLIHSSCLVGRCGCSNSTLNVDYWMSTQFTLHIWYKPFPSMATQYWSDLYLVDFWLARTLTQPQTQKQ